MSSFLPNEDTLEPDDTFKQLEYLCEDHRFKPMASPKIFLNDLPMDNSIYGVESDPAQKQHNVSFLSTFDKPSITSVQLYKSFPKRDTVYNSYANATDADTRPSAYFSDTSHFICESHADGYEFAKFDDSVLESSQNSSGYHGSRYKLRDTLDECEFRRKSEQFNLKEPSTPIKRTFSGQRLDLYGNDSVDLSSSSGRFSYSNKSGGTTAADLDEEHVIAELQTSMYNMTTSSPIPNAVGGGASFRKNADEGEPVDLDNTLERVNHILAKGGFKTPSPTRMVRRRCLMKKYVSDLLQRDSFYKQVSNTATKSKKFFVTPKLRKVIKRTISVDDSLKMLHANTWKAQH